MSACRAERRLAALRLALAGVAALWACATPPLGPAAWAQLGPPVRLVPRIEGGDEAPPIRPREAVPDRPAGPALIAPLGENPTPVPADPVPRDFGGARRNDPSTIEVGQPKPLDADGIGLIDAARGGFPDSLWNGSSRPMIERLIGQIPAPIVSPATRNLAVRLLVSGGLPPAAAPVALSTDTRSFVGRRAEKLQALGDTATAVGLARMAPGRGEDETLARVLLDGASIGNDAAEACALTLSQIAQFDDAYRQKSLIFCQASNNDKGRAQLGLRMLREQQPEDDPLFGRLIALVLGETKVPLDSLKLAAPLHLAMARAARQPLPADSAQGAIPTVLGMVATSTNAPGELKLIAAERAEIAGALPTATLAQLYDGATVRPEDIARAFDIASRDRGPRGRLLPYRAAKAQVPGAGRLATLARYWQLSRERAGYAAAARITLPLLLEVSPESDLATYAGEATRALLLVAHGADARRWFEVAAAAALADPNISDTVALTWPLLRIAGEAADIADGEATARLAAWDSALRRLNPANSSGQVAMLAVLLSALGDRAASELLGQAVATPAPPRATAATPGAGVMIGLGEAAAARRGGETVLFALEALGGDGPASIDLLSLSRVIESLRAVGLTADARALALEAAILGGL